MALAMSFYQRAPLQRSLRLTAEALARSRPQTGAHRPARQLATTAASTSEQNGPTQKGPAAPPTKGGLLRMWEDLDFRTQRIRTTSEPHLRRAKVDDLEKQSVQPGFWDEQKRAQSVLRVRLPTAAGQRTMSIDPSSRAPCPPGLRRSPTSALKVTTRRSALRRFSNAGA